MAQHKWHKEIKAWADGEDVEIRIGKRWVGCNEPVWSEQTEYRIKPQQQQSSCCKCQQTCSALKEPQYLYVLKNNLEEIRLVDYKPHPLQEYVSTTWKCIGKIKLEDEASSSGE